MSISIAIAILLLGQLPCFGTDCEIIQVKFKLLNMAKDKRTHVECKCCKKRLWSNRILQHLNHATKSDCKSNYSEDELNKLKEASQKRSANLRKKWKKKNKTYYASQRAGYYQVNKYTLSKKSSQKAFQPSVLNSSLPWW